MKPDRHWYQYSLRSLFLLILLASMGMNWLMVILQRARRQEKTETTVWNVGGEVAYDYQFDSLGNMIDAPIPPGPVWLRRVFGEHFFANVRFVNLSFREKADQGLEHIDGLPELPTLGLCGSQVTDAGLEHIKGLTKLKNLDVSYTKITDSGLRHFKWLTQLRNLDLRHTRITDDGLRYVNGLQYLEDLSLGGSNITDAGLRYLNGLLQLKVLCLPETNITDAGLEHLAGLRELKELWLLDTKVTADGVRKLQKILPNCDIHYSNP